MRLARVRQEQLQVPQLSASNQTAVFQQQCAVGVCVLVLVCVPPAVVVMQLCHSAWGASTVHRPQLCQCSWVGLLWAQWHQCACVCTWHATLLGPAVAPRSTGAAAAAALDSLAAAAVDESC